jgi:hypothetical protein
VCVTDADHLAAIHLPFGNAAADVVAAPHRPIRTQPAEVPKHPARRDTCPAVTDP